MTIPRLLRGATAPAAGIMLALAGLAPAQAAAVPRWTVAKVITPRTGTLMLSSIVATSKTDAWSAGTIFSQSGEKARTRVLVEHFDGHRWAQFPLPSRLQAVNLSAQVIIGASSASSVWVFELRTGHTQRILRWNGHRWIVMSAPAWVYRATRGSQDGDAAVAVLGKAGTWIFSIDASAEPTEAALYVHGRWTHEELPATPYSVAEVAANDIWADGWLPADPSQSVIMHWNGRSWAVHDAPALDNAPIVSQDANSTWLLNGDDLYYWSRGTWTTIAVPPGLGLYRMATDGHGGVWLWGPHLVGADQFTPYVIAHYNDGTWTRQNAPGVDGNALIPLAAMAQAPGSTTVFGAGWLAGSHLSGAILQYGS